MHLVLVRHGESEGNAAGIIQGRVDYGLSPRGHAQAAATAAELGSVPAARLLTSPLRRAQETAASIGQALGLEPCPDPALLEYDLGEVSGLTIAELRARYPEALRANARGRRFAFPGEEGRDVFQARLQGLLDTLADSEGTTIAVAHGGVISALCRMVVGMEAAAMGAFEVANCSLTEVTRDRTGRLVLARHNDTCHLAGVEAQLV